MDTLMTAIDITHVSEEPWSNWTKADYTPEQWHRACILHLHTGPVDNKEQCKLPVRTPAGALNRNGVHAAAAALAGARGGVNAPPAKIAAARATLRGLYSQIGEGEKKPESLTAAELAEGMAYLVHYGVLGMKWGVRRSAAELGRARAGPSAESAATRVIRKQARSTGTSSLTNKQLQTAINRMNLERQYSSLNPSDYQKGKRIAKGILAAGTTAVAVYNMVNSPAGKAAIALIKSRMNK
jgi:hypothetical protein